MSGNVRRKGWGDQKWRPAWIGRRTCIAIKLGIANCRYGTPKVERVLGIPGTNGGIGHGNVQQSEEPGVLFQRIAANAGNSLRNTIPVTRRRLCPSAIGPEQSDLRLLFRAR